MIALLFPDRPLSNGEADAVSRLLFGPDAWADLILDPGTWTERQTIALWMHGCPVVIGRGDTWREALEAALCHEAGLEPNRDAMEDHR